MKVTRRSCSFLETQITAQRKPLIYVRATGYYDVIFGLDTTANSKALNFVKAQNDRIKNERIKNEKPTTTI